MEALPSGIVDIVRDFFEAHERLGEIVESGRAHHLNFAALRALVGEDDDSLLFRLKERCHTTFRSQPDEPSGMAREALFDLAIGSLFHEAMKLRENVYQLEVYAPKVRLLRAAPGGASDPLFDEFEKIMSAVEDRLDEAIGETEALLAHTVEQLRVLLCSYAETGLVTRFLIARRAQTERVFSEGLDGLLAQMHGDAGEGYSAAARSYLESAFLPEALEMIEAARKGGADAGMLARLERYALGVSAFQDEDYATSLAHLEAWLDATPEADERGFAQLVTAALGRVDRLVAEDDPARAESLERAARVRERLEAWVSSGERAGSQR